MPRLLLGLLLCCLTVVTGCKNLLLAPPLVGVIQWSDKIALYNESRQGVEEGLREEGYQDGLNIRLEVMEVGADRGRTAAAVEYFQEKGARLLITLGTVPTLIALDLTRDSRLPIVYGAVGSPNATGLAWPQDPRQVRFTGASMEVPAAEQLHYLLLALPKLKRLGILNCTITPQGVATAESAASAAGSLGLTVIRETITDGRTELVQEALEKLINQNIEALFIPTDPVLTDPRNLQVIGDAALKAWLPVMVSSRGSVAYGALLAYHCDFIEIGRQAGRQAARLLGGAPLAQVPPETPRIKRLTLNLAVAHALQLSLSRHLLSQAHHLVQ